MSDGLAEPSVGFCTVPDAGRVAHASHGSGPALVMVPGWLSHVADLWSHPAAARSLSKLGTGHRFVWYDRLGCGLSDRDPGTYGHAYYKLKVGGDVPADVERLSRIAAGLYRQPE